MNTHSCQANVGDSERLLSMGVGGFLAGWGLRRLFSGSGLLAAAAGGALIYRGVTGYCPLYSAMEQQRELEHECSHASMSGSRPPAEGYDRDMVGEADEESFPASDAPAWTGASTTRAGSSQSEQPS